MLSSVVCVDDMSAVADATAGVGMLYYCPSCDAFGRGGVHDHEVLVLGMFRGDWCAWLTGAERMAPIFLGIEVIEMLDLLLLLVQLCLCLWRN